MYLEHLEHHLATLGTMLGDIEDHLGRLEDPDRKHLRLPSLGALGSPQ